MITKIRVIGLQCAKEDTHCVISPHLITEQVGISDIQMGEYTCRVIQPKQAPAAVNYANFAKLNSQQTHSINPQVQPFTVIVTFANIWRRDVGTNVFFLKTCQNLKVSSCRQLGRRDIITGCYTWDMSLYTNTHDGIEIPIKS